MKEDQSTKKWLAQLLTNLETPATPAAAAIGPTPANGQSSSGASLLSQPTQPASPLGMN